MEKNKLGKQLISVIDYLFINVCNEYLNYFCTVNNWYVIGTIFMTILLHCHLQIKGASDAL